MKFFLGIICCRRRKAGGRVMIPREKKEKEERPDFHAMPKKYFRIPRLRINTWWYFIRFPRNRLCRNNSEEKVWELYCGIAADTLHKLLLQQYSIVFGFSNPQSQYLCFPLKTGFFNNCFWTSWFIFRTLLRRAQDSPKITYFTYSLRSW